MQYSDCRRSWDMNVQRRAAHTGLRTNNMDKSVNNNRCTETDDAHAAAAFLRFCHEKMSANEGKDKVAEDPAKHAPTPALHEG